MRLRFGELLCAASGLALLVSLFLPWFGQGTGCGGAGLRCGGSLDAWQALHVIDLLLLVAAVAAIGFALIAATNSKSDLPIVSAAFTVPIGVVASGLVLYRLLEPAIDGRRFGLYVGLAASLGITLGSWLAMRDERPRGSGR